MRSLGYDMNEEVALAIAEKLDEQTDKGCVAYSVFKAYFYKYHHNNQASLTQQK